MMEVLRQLVETSEDVFAVRQRSRNVAHLAGFEESDQVRIATALSEVTRDVLGTHGGGSVSIGVEHEQLRIVVSGFGALDPATFGGVAAARRLMSSVFVEGGANMDHQVVMTRRLPHDVPADQLRAMVSSIAMQVISSPLDELRSQNSDLAAALEELTVRQEEQLRLNEELEETNRGVVAMYSQLSDELDSTNRGVVALYAELDDASRKLEEASAQKSRFLASVSHELRSPISSAIGITRLLLDPADGVGEAHRRHVELVNGSANELLELVNQLLDLAKAESGRLEPRFSDVALQPLIAEVVESLRPLAMDGVSLATVFESDGLELRTDEQLFRQVLRNLVANALTFTETGAVHIAVRHVGDDLLVEVADTGVGIPDEHLARIFEEFHQVPGRLQRTRRGTGLGLPFAKRVTGLLHGVLSVDSTVGTGSTFTLRFAPPTDAQGQLGDAGAHDDGVMPTGVVDRVLVVDDDPGFRTILVQMLGPVVGTIVSAEDGLGAMERLRESPYDVVMLDMTMPAMGGEALLQAIDEMPQHRATPVIIVTSVDVDDVAPAVRRRAAAILSKHDVSAATVQRAVLATRRTT